MNRSRVKANDNIEFLIYIGEYKVVLNTPKQTRVGEVINMVRSYESIHQNYGPHNAHFIGLASDDGNQVIDYWMTQAHYNFIKFKSKLCLKALYAIDKKIDTLSTNNFQFLKCLGQGACGSVYLVRNRTTGYLFALKRVKKLSLRSDQDFKSIFRQQKILRTLPSNNYTVKFHGCFESMDHFNYLLEFYPGGELFVHLSRQRLQQRDVKIYFCQVLSAIQFLHKNNILYRDLKPQNILVDMNGHLFIGDFGLSKCGFKEEDNANSHCGSPDYMAPEIIQNKQYNFSSDFYSIGAILYEFLTGIPPYYQSGQNGDDEHFEQKLLAKIKKMNLKLEEHTKDPHLKSLIKGLLHPNPDLRITSFQQIKNSPWLVDIDWKKIQQKTFTMPFAPNVYKTYINQQFLDKQDQLQDMNRYECEKFQSFQFFDYIRPESEKMVLGRTRTEIKQHNPMKRKMNPLIKEKSTKNLNNKSTVQQSHQASKGNISIALYQKHAHREERGDTASTANSNVSCYEAKTTKHADNKQNFGFKKQGSKKNLLKKVPSIAKMPTNPTTSAASSHNVSQCSSRKIGTSRQKGGLTLKTRNTQLLKSRGNLTPAHKSKSKQKGQTLLGQSKNPYVSLKNNKKQMLPVSSYKIKLM